MNLVAPLAIADVIGCDAMRAFAGGSGEIAAVFRRSFYVRIEEHWACAGSAEIGYGPLNVLLHTDSDLDWRNLLRPGQSARVHRGSLLIQGLPPVILADALIWEPPPAPSWSAASVLAGLAELDRLLAHFPPPDEGLGCFSGTVPDNKTAAARAAAKPIQSLSIWLAAGCQTTSEPPVEDLLGLGPGLTPSGDDFLAGVLATLHAINARKCMHIMWSRLKAHLTTSTNSVSAAHLRCAACGRLAAAQHDLLGAILTANTAGLSHALQIFSREPHTSPWDGLAGIATALRAIFRNLRCRYPLRRCPISLGSEPR